MRKMQVIFPYIYAILHILIHIMVHATAEQKWQPQGIYTGFSTISPIGFPSLISLLPLKFIFWPLISISYRVYLTSAWSLGYLTPTQHVHNWSNYLLQAFPPLIHQLLSIVSFFPATQAWKLSSRHHKMKGNLSSQSKYSLPFFLNHNCSNT